MNKIVPSLVSVFVLVLAAPAYAQTGPGAKINSPGDGAVLSGSLPISGTGTASTGVRSAKMFIEDSLVASAEPSNLKQSVDLDYTWDTKTAPSGGIARNGWYQIRIEVVANGGGTASEKISVMVDNAPQAPTGLDGVVQDATATLTWAANPEPDISAYRVEVSNGQGWSTATETTSTTYMVTSEPGTYSYRVSAIRSTPDSSGGHVSSPSSPITLTIQADRTTYVDGGGGRGSAGGGDPRIYGRDGTASSRDVKRTARAFSGGLSFGGLSLPGQLGLPDLPSTTPFEWGSFKQRLPYSLPQGGIALDAAPPRLAAMSTTTIIPMDALRWVGAGMLMIVLAVFLQFLTWRAETIHRLGAEGAAALAVSFEDAHLRLRRIQDRVRTTWSKARSS